MKRIARAEKSWCFDVVWVGSASAVYVCVEKGKGILDLYDLITMEHKHQEHKGIEVLEVVGSLVTHGEPVCCRILSTCFFVSQTSTPLSSVTL